MAGRRRWGRAGAAAGGGAATGLLDGHDPVAASGYPEHPPRVGFFTDTSICIGCKACEVACKEWNRVPEDGLQLTGMSYDNTGELGADTWRHVAFIEQRLPAASLPPGGPGAPVPGGSGPAPPASPGPGSSGAPSGGADGAPAGGADGIPAGSAGTTGVRWLMSSDVCKHCSRAACLDVCPTGALFRTELGAVVVQRDVCNGCGYCIPACPYGVIGQRPGDGRAWKCTLCSDRLAEGLRPACATACPTRSIQFGPLDELREQAARRLAELHGAGVAAARLYGHDPGDGVGGAGAFFLLLDEPEVYGLPPDPVVTTRDLPAMWRRVALAATALAGAGLAAFAGRRR